MTVYTSLEDAAVANRLGQSGVLVIPTDTLYGVVARAGDQAAVERLYRLKSREHKPGTLVAATVDQLVELGLKRRYLKAFEDYWPGAVSAVIPCGPELGYLHQGKFGLAVRIPADQALRSLLEKTGPLLTSSANRPGEPVAVTVAEAQAYFDETVDGYVEGGDMTGSPPSTLIRVVDDAIEVLRQGAVIIDASGRQSTPASS